jgi:hypothetical protein
MIATSIASQKKKKKIGSKKPSFSQIGCNDTRKI